MVNEYSPETLCKCGHEQKYHLLSIVDGIFYAQGCVFNLTHADPSGFVLYCKCTEFQFKENQQCPSASPILRTP
jgi:hypothetical protein